MNKLSFRGIEFNYCNNNLHFQEVERGEWEQETFDVLDKFLQPGKVFLDIGAWARTLSIYAAKKGAISKAYEPDSIANANLLNNVSANSFKQPATVVIMGKTAVSNDWGEVPLYGNVGDSMSSTTRIEVIHEMVKTVPLSDTLSNDICLIKIDTEGGEVNILTKEAVEALKSVGTPPILLSIHPAWIPNFQEWWDMVNKEYSTIYDITPVSNHTFLFTSKI